MNNVKLNMIPEDLCPIIHVSQYDNGRKIRLHLFENKTNYVLDGTEVLSVIVRKPDNTLVSLDIANVFEGKSYVDFFTTEQMCACAGEAYGEFTISKNGTSVSSKNFVFLVEGAPDEGGITSQSEINNLARQVHNAVVEELEDNGASETGYDNTESGLEATNVQDAIDEVNTKIDNIPSVDAYTKEQSDSFLADEYDATQTYAVGDYRIHEGGLYICNTAISTAEAWNASHWTLTDVGSALATTSEAVNGKADANLNNVPDSVIPQSKLSFAEVAGSENLFNVEDNTMHLEGYWYWSNHIGTTMTPEQNQYTTQYIAITIPVFNAGAFTMGCYPATAGTNRFIIFWVGAVDEDMVLLDYAQPSAEEPYTYNVPANAKYLLISARVKTEQLAYLQTFMVLSGSRTITEYIPYVETYYLNNCKLRSIDELNATVTGIEADVDNIQSIVGNGENAVKICAPDSYDLVVGDTFELFYKGIIKANNVDLFDVQITCSKGNAFIDRFIITPSVVENLSLTIAVYGINHNLLDTKTITLSVHAKATSPASQKNVLCVGDSLTTNGQWVAELERRLTASGGTPTGDNLSNISFIGTCYNNGVHFEGYGGWTFNSYNTANISNTSKVITCSHDKTEAQDQHSIYEDANGAQWKLETIESGTIKIILVSGNASNFPSTGTLTWVSGGVNHSNITYTASANASANPFWDSDNNKVDFGKYATNLGVSSIDYVAILLGWNNASSTEENYKQQAQTFINNVKASFPNAKIILMGIEIPARDGLANNYGASGTYSKYYGLVEYVFDLDKWYKDLVASNVNVSSINISGQFDTVHNMPTLTRTVNNRNSESEVYQSNGIHPANSGYMQIADAIYRHLTGLI